MITMQLRQTLSLFRQLARGGHDDDHICSTVGMKLLRSHLAYDGGLGKRCGTQGRHWNRIPEAQLDIVEMHICARRLTDGHDGTVIRQIVDAERPYVRCRFHISVESLFLRGCGLLVNKNVAQNVIAQIHRSVAVAGIGHHDAEGGLAASFRRQLVSLFCTRLEETLVEEIAPAMKPCEIIYFVEGVVIVGRRIERCGKLGAVEKQRLFIALGEEIATYVAVGIADTCRRCRSVPVYRSYGVEQTPPVYLTCRHLRQLAGGCEIGLRQCLRLQGATITEDTHMLRMVKTGSGKQRVCQLIDARLRDGNLYKTAGKLGILRQTISLRFLRVTIPIGLIRLYHRFEAGQHHVLPASSDKGHNGGVETAAPTFRTDVAVDNRPIRQLLACEFLIAAGLLTLHGLKLRIFYADGIDRVLVIRSQFLYEGELRHHAVDVQLGRGEREETLCYGLYR